MGRARALADILHTPDKAEYFSVLTKNGKEVRIRPKGLYSEANYSFNKNNSVQSKTSNDAYHISLGTFDALKIKMVNGITKYSKTNLPSSYKDTGFRYFLIINYNQTIAEITFSKTNVKTFKIYTFNKTSNKIEKETTSLIIKNNILITTFNSIVSNIPGDALLIESYTDKVILAKDIYATEINIYGVVLQSNKYTLPDTPKCIRYYNRQGIFGFFYTTETRANKKANIYFYNVATKEKTNLGRYTFSYDSGNLAKAIRYFYCHFEVYKDQIIIASSETGKLPIYNIVVKNNTPQLVNSGGGIEYTSSIISISSGQFANLKHWVIFGVGGEYSGSSYLIGDKSYYIGRSTYLYYEDEVNFGNNIINTNGGEMLGVIKSKDKMIFTFGYTLRSTSIPQAKATRATGIRTISTRIDIKVLTKEIFPEASHLYGYYLIIADHPDINKIFATKEDRKDIFTIETSDDWKTVQYKKTSYKIKTKDQFFKELGYKS